MTLDHLILVEKSFVFINTCVKDNLVLVVVKNVSSPSKSQALHFPLPLQKLEYKGIEIHSTFYILIN
jgi:hypothetical protein